MYKQVWWIGLQIQIYCQFDVSGFVAFINPLEMKLEKVSVSFSGRSTGDLFSQGLWSMTASKDKAMHYWSHSVFAWI